MKVVISENQLRRLVNIISETSREKKNVLFIGDSLSSGRGYTWNYLLESKHPEWNVKHIVEGGRRTDWMLENLKKELISKSYDLVFIWGGTNDMFSLVSIGKAISNLQEMADLVIDQGGKPIIFAGYDVKSVMLDEKLKPTKYCDKECMLRSRDRMVEFQNKLESGVRGAKVIGRIKDQGISAGDGTHIGGTGHQIIADYVDSKLNSTISDIKKIDKNVTSSNSWVSLISDFIVNPIKSFFFGNKKLPDKLIDDLEKIKENKIYKKSDFLINEEKKLEYKKGFIEYDKNVEPIQVALQLLGYSLDKWGIDGKFGPETKQAVINFQEENGIKPTGKVTSDVIRKLIGLVKSKNFTEEDFKNLNVSKTDSFNEKSMKSKVGDVQLVGMDFEDFAIKKHSDEFIDRVKEIGRKVGLDYKLILATMYFESKMSPSAVNQMSKATGLIQFMPFTAKSLGTTTDNLRTMSALKQLDYVEKFYEMNRRFISKIQSPEEAYFLVFYPAAIGKSDDFVLGSEISPERARVIRKQNAPLDTNSDSQITKGEIKRVIRNKWGLA